MTHAGHRAYKKVDQRNRPCDLSTVSKWCTNTSQPDMETLARISKLLDVSVEDLYNKRFMESPFNATFKKRL